jgi:dolichol-phosphate mannosyltransferase
MSQAGCESLRLGIVCPMANEAENAEDFIHEVLKACCAYPFKEIVFLAVLDKASTDGTLALLRRLAETLTELRVVYAPENRCVVDAYLRGHREALAAGVDWILEIDAGFSHQPGEIPRFLDKMLEGHDCVFGSRFTRRGRYLGGIGRRYLVSRLGSALTNALMGTRLSDMTSGFQAFTATALAHILQHGIVSRGPFFQTEMKIHASCLRITEVPITYRPTAQAVRPGALTDALRVLLVMVRHRWRNRLASEPA